MKNTTFSDDWKIWIWSNVARGCAKDGIFKILHEKGFDYHAIKSELNYEPDVPLDEIGDPLQFAPDNNCTSLYVPNSRRVDSDRLELYTLDNFLTPDECTRIIELMKTKLRPSTITNEEEADTYFRTSKTCDFALFDDPLPAELNIRICRTLGINPSYAEEIQGQIYDVGEEFKAHTDWFTPGTDEFTKHAGVRGQRSWTFMIYLNDVESGGETLFTEIDHLEQARVGKAVFWNNLYPDGRPNPDSMHHALPVKAGHKAVITKWFRVNGTGDMNIKSDAELIPNFSDTGFRKANAPEPVFSLVKKFLHENQSQATREYESADYLANEAVHPTSIIELPEQLKMDIASAMKPVIEEWTDIEVELSAVYGIRRYHRGTVLTAHRDRIDSHILSAIINVDQQVDAPWPLEIEDNYYRSHQVLLEPGQMILYESARLMHGRATPLMGDHYDNLFVHFRPAMDNWPEGRQGH